MIQIRSEAEDIVTGKQPRDNNVLKNAPHPVSVLAEEEWSRSAIFLSRRIIINHDVCQALLSSRSSVPPSLAFREEVLADSVAH